LARHDRQLYRAANRMAKRKSGLGQTPISTGSHRVAAHSGPGRRQPAP
jgi:hypothetical protein